MSALKKPAFTKIDSGTTCVISVFFDGKCGLCRREIRHYQKVAPPDTFRWVDVNSNPLLLEDLGISQVQALRALHARTEEGVVSSGVAAFVVLWSALPRWRVLAWFISLPGVRWIAEILYEKFADYRFRRLAHCQAALSSHG
jgi:predicted DCC family thiol-disulfide oxidoreductase YuxK